MFFDVLARKEENELGEVKSQSLTEHLLSVGKIASQIGDLIGIKHLMMHVGLLHDMGKADRNFQTYLNGSSNKKVDHSSAGAKLWIHILSDTKEYEEYYNTVKFQYYKEIILYLIQSHHGLFDVIDTINIKNKSFERLKYDSKVTYHFNDDVLNYYNYFNNYLIQNENYSMDELIWRGFEEFNVIFNKLKQMAKSNPLAESKKVYLHEFNYYISCFVRLCLSILKEADIYDSANVFEAEKQKVWNQEELQSIWNEAYSKIEMIYRDYENVDKPSELNYTRTEMSKVAKQFASNYKEGIFQLEMPTGAGKTKTSLRYALTNAKNYNRKRIFYITAFLSVLEQNANEIKNIISNDTIVLEHHSNILLEERKDDEQFKYDVEHRMLSYLKESWEAPIILTTMVQFCNTLFKGQASQIRRFCKLIDSVIIIDEVQSLPLKAIYNFNLMMNFMKNIMHCNIVHCTATQPILNSKALKYPVYYGDLNNNNFKIIEKKLIKRTCFDRVVYYNLTGSDARKKMSTYDIIQHVEKTLRDFDSCLIVLNTKKAVRTLYDEFSNQMTNEKIVYLTTNLCAAHRLEIIDEVKQILIKNRNGNSKTKLICISTQLIEAGVDLDFDCVYRSMAGIDSLVQCAGRCNREGKLTKDGQYIQGKIYIINYDMENLANLQDIRQTVTASEEAIRSISIANDEEQISLDEIKSYYFNKYYIENEKKMSYCQRKDGDNMIEQLSINKSMRIAYEQYHYTKYPFRLAQAFREAADNFELIKHDTVGVIVYYKNEDLIEQLLIAIEKRDSYEISKLLKKLQRTTVNVYFNEKLQGYVQNIIKDKVKDGQIWLLDKHYYDEKLGIVTEGLADFIV
ncbi:CRISPR-associated helicase/endonuclease Cas3 [Herbinix luporum]|uniref:CRISPR-associated helicase Cas3 n=1 Tax=Herbinix luporum TaxID=1679721 RepID=A0A0K8J429_9FIRM|nr:CRISPR-associated helicase/endonuclease Cas3 [Herbinix luporum]CUH92083.1 hypothetical protein SD1D_0531 [Herbinix luporum]